ncbi:MAG: creatininase family protein [Burkholderiales bacterium]|nr:creatininase family protein [Burkholderiales bacterium]
MRYKSRFWADYTAREIALLPAGEIVAVLPVAAIEQHGPHLPLSVDTTLVDGVIASALPHIAPEVGALFLPTQQIGKSNEHARFAGTLTLSAPTLIAAWMEIGASVAAAGVRKLVLFNSHGGQVAVMDIVARDLRARHDMLVYASNWYTLGLPDGLFDAHEMRFGIHAGDLETSMMLALRPDLVDMRFAENFASTSAARAQAYPLLGNGQAAKLGWQTQDLNPKGAAGNALAASAAKGQAVLDFVGRRLAQLLAEVARLPPDTLVDAPAPYAR